MKHTVLVARVLLVLIVLFGIFLSVTSSLWWIPVLWIVSGILACTITKVWDVIDTGGGRKFFDQMIATMIVGSCAGLILLLIVATDRDNGNPSRP